MSNKIKEIDDTCKLYDISNYTINKDGSIDVYGDVNLINRGFKKIPLKFNNVYGNCVISLCYLISLKGSPVYVGGRFDCSYNKLTDLKYSPREIDKEFYCSFNKLINLEYGPERIGEGYICRENVLTSLKGVPKNIYSEFNCSNNELISLKYGPERVYGFYNCSHNKLKNLKGCAKFIGGNLRISDNPDLYTFEGLNFFNLKNINCENTVVYNVWKLFEDASKIELFNDMDIIRKNKGGKPVIILDRLNQFLDMVGKPTVKKVDGYINI